MADRTALIMDVDTGIDDSLALLYAAASPDADLVAVTCVFGNVDAHQVGLNTRAILELAGRSDVEVAMGRETPLERPLRTTPETHGQHGLGYAALPPPSRLRGHVQMGGAFGTSGNTTPTAEWNVHCDPEAARIVYRAWSAAIAAGPATPRSLVLGLDVTERARITPDDVVRLARRAGSRPDDSIALARGEDPLRPVHSVASDPIVRCVADALRFYFEFHDAYDGFYGAFIHDPLAVAAALDRTLVRTLPLYVDVETRGELTTGMTVADTRHLTDQPANADVVMEAEVATFLDRLIERIGGLAAERTAAADAGRDPERWTG
jgi:purine nucleosidase